MKRIERAMGTSNANRDTWRAKAAISAVSALESGPFKIAHFAKLSPTSALRGGPSPKIAPDSNGRLTDHASRLGSSGFARAVQYFGMRVYRPTPLHSGDMVGVR
jgi:hypothetical protein